MIRRSIISFLKIGATKEIFHTQVAEQLSCEDKSFGQNESVSRMRNNVELTVSYKTEPVVGRMRIR